MKRGSQIGQNPSYKKEEKNPEVQIVHKKNTVIHYKLHANHRKNIWKDEGHIQSIHNHLLLGFTFYFE